MTDPARRFLSRDLEPPLDGRQSEAALSIQRGVIRVFASHAISCLTEVALPNGRRADVMAVTGDGEIWIVEIKSCLNDFRSDGKWPDYKDFCDKFFFAVGPDFPTDVLPDEAGLLIADTYGGDILRTTDCGRLAPARRKAVTLRFARIAAARLSNLHDPRVKVPII